MGRLSVQGNRHGGGGLLSARWRRAVALATAVLLFTAAGCGDDDDGGEQSADEFEFFSWWTGGGDSEGKEALLELFADQNPDIEFINAAVAGGAGTNAKAVLADRLLANDPPDSYQRHAGLELLDDIKAGEVEDLTYLYDGRGLEGRVPPGPGRQDHRRRQDLLGAGEHPPVQPACGSTPQVLQRCGISAPPKTWAEFLTQAETLKAAGKVAALDRPRLDPEAPARERPARRARARQVQRPVGRQDRLGVAGGDRRPGDLQQGAGLHRHRLGSRRLAAGAGQDDRGHRRLQRHGRLGGRLLRAPSKGLTFGTGYDVAPSPGTDGVYNFLSDTFTLPVGAPHRDVPRTKWLTSPARRRARTRSTRKKGSVPARTDPDKSLYKGYLAQALERVAQPDDQGIVGSLAHGVVANNAWNGRDRHRRSACSSRTGTSAKFAAAVKQAYEAHARRS